MQLGPVSASARDPNRMRRRPIILSILAAAVLGGASIALADPPSTTNAVPALAQSPAAQVGPVLAINPASGATASAAVLATDWRAGALQPQTVFGNGVISGTTGMTVWSDHGLLPSTTGNSPNSLGGGSPDVVWGPGNKVYAVELGRDQSDPQNPCSTSAGLFLSVSTNAGASFGSPITLASSGPNVQISDPSVTVNNDGRIYVAYTKTTPCGGGPGSNSSVRLVSTNDDVAGNGKQIANVADGGSNPQFGRPSIAALPNGDVAVAYYDGAPADGPPGNVDVALCSTAPSGAVDCLNTTPPAVVVDPSASDPDAIGGLGVQVRPAIAAGLDGRIVVTWAKATLGGITVYSATSLDQGLNFGLPQQVSAGTGDQFDPSVAIASDGRADIAYYDSRLLPLGFQVAVTASNRPSGTVETWSPSQIVESTQIIPTSPFAPGPPSLGSRIAVAEIPRSTGRAWTLVAWTDTRNTSTSTNEDIYSTVLLHQSTMPVATPYASPVSVPKNSSSAVPFGDHFSDPDADPLFFRVVDPGGLGVATIADPNIPTLTYRASPVEGADTVRVEATDGVNTATLDIPLQLQNSRPQINCTSIPTTANTTVLFATTGCASDPNDDSITYIASAPEHGTIVGSGPTLGFMPTPGFSGTGSVVLSASDGEVASDPVRVPVIIAAPAAIQVMITSGDTRAGRTDRPLEFRARPLVDTADPASISWDFGDGSAPDHGPSVSHLFSKVASYTVSARIGTGPPYAVKVIVQPPPLVVRETSLLHRDTLELKLQLSGTGKLVVALSGVSGARRLSRTMTRGTHTLRMPIPRSTLARGTIVVSFALTLGNGGVDRLRRAVLLPR